MARAPELPFPTLTAQTGASVAFATDDALAARFGVRIAFTGRDGGVSEAPYASLNLGGHVGDSPQAVAENRSRLLAALGAPSAPLIVPNQVHGTDLVSVDDAGAASLAAACDAAAAGADGLVVGVPGVAALLCFADCVPVIVVAPSGRFAVVHAGWRGAVAGIAGKAARALAAADAAEFGTDEACAARSLNAYIGPHIRQECFEVGDDVAAQFAERFGSGCVDGHQHVSLATAVTADMVGAGMDQARIADMGACTACEPDRFFSYRASGGVCGRHGAAAVRMKG